jgi:ribosomal protein S27AE
MTKQRKQKQTDESGPETDIEHALDPAPEIEATRRLRQCPRCRHVSSEKAVVFGTPNRYAVRGLWNGVEYSVVETSRIMCEKCGQIHFIKKYT